MVRRDGNIAVCNLRVAVALLWKGKHIDRNKEIAPDGFVLRCPFPCRCLDRSLYIVLLIVGILIKSNRGLFGNLRIARE